MTAALCLAIATTAVLAEDGEDERGKEKQSSRSSSDGAKTESEKSIETAAKRPLEDELQRTSDGKIRFSFRGQQWLDVLQWLAKSANRTLDWQELPEGVLNLDTQQSYTLDEARDLLNMHLAARGFTLLRRGEVLSLTKLDKLNPTLVPRVEADELASRDLHEVVRVSFPLTWLVAEDSVKEFQPMLSPFGKLTAMTATNRLEGLDTVSNLLEIRKLLDHEQSSNGKDRLVVEFKLKHVRADDILQKLRELVAHPPTAVCKLLRSCGGSLNARASGLKRGGITITRRDAGPHARSPRCTWSSTNRKTASWLTRAGQAGGHRPSGPGARCARKRRRWSS